MEYNSYIYNKSHIDCALFSSEMGRGEIHAIISADEKGLPYEDQAEIIFCGIDRLLSANKDFAPVAMRVYLSDAANQAEYAMGKLSDKYDKCALAYIEQPPLNGTKIAVLVYAIEGVSPERIDEYSVKVSNGEMKHIWSANVCCESVNTLSETYCQLGYLGRMLENNKSCIADNCVRTWFYVQNIDVNYAAVVEARKDFFNQNGLTADNHYIASTGIGGRHADKKITSVMDAYSVGGLKIDQMRYLYAAENMNRTSDYGVTFERGTAVDYADRREIYISGTASIDNKGSIVAVGDIRKQTMRMLENVDALLSEGEANRDNIAYAIVYLRDVADYGIVKDIMDREMKDIPRLITLAPVCRPGWLIEMECIATSPRDSNYPQY